MGAKQRDILTAEGQGQAMKELAEAEKFRQIALAEGEAAATQATFAAIHQGDPTPDLIAIKYLEALAEVANGRATKVFLPLDSTGYLGSLAGIAELFRGDRPAPPPARPPAPA